MIDVSTTTQGGNVMSRKEMVNALGEHLGIKPQYLGAPSFAYQVGEFTVDRQGIIANKVGEEVELRSILAGEDPTVERDITAIEVTVPLDGHDGKTLTNLVNMVCSKQALIKKALSLEGNMVEQGLMEKLKEGEPTTIEEFLSLAKSSTSGITFNLEGITFTSINTEPEAIKAFTDLVGLLNVKAKELKYASPKPVDTDNEKYTFRAWIMRLRMLGPEYKITRKILLQNLSGNTAFRKVGENHEA